MDVLINFYDTDLIMHTYIKSCQTPQILIYNMYSIFVHIICVLYNFVSYTLIKLEKMTSPNLKKYEKVLNHYFNAM